MLISVRPVPRRHSRLDERQRGAVQPAQDPPDVAMLHQRRPPAELRHSERDEDGDRGVAAEPPQAVLQYGLCV
jgi:hypothetical protein